MTTTPFRRRQVEMIMVVVVPNTLASRRMVRNYNLQVMRVKRVVRMSAYVSQTIVDRDVNFWSNIIQTMTYNLKMEGLVSLAMNLRQLSTITCLQ